MATVNEGVEAAEPEEEKDNVQTGSLVSQSLPHEYQEDALEFSVESFHLDGGPLGDRGDLDEDDQFLSLVDEADWKTLELEGTVTVDQDIVEDVFPFDEWEETPGRLALVKENPLAINRDRQILADSPFDGGTYEFTLCINRDDHRGQVKIKPFLTRTKKGGSGGSKHASKVGARVADGLSWVIRLDEREDGGSLLMPIIEDFSDYDSFPDENHIHHLSLEAPRNPQLYLNREHPQVVEVLNNTGSTGGPPRLRDVLYDYIEHSVWTQLLIQTAHDTSPDTGEPEYGWQEDVLDIFLDDLYPNLGDDEAAIQLAEDVRSHADLPDLVQRIERAVHQQYNIPSDTTNLIEEAIQSDD
ncbi:hypothetical protein [Natrarchaeobaculum sulfurireducens]|uniref:Uncharacterized protein n=1 Tax=Natrarchaeobaculum sulfurireducens TaxID=2044521 RepID=A0A346PJE2_9EURY|nr:hypothetical protein [Natrarchaeobaculum sulfurireducens]AXR79637.1 hypothetical protein AArc1_3337 [Natrarchaeobaculum sulfurireducens]